VPILGKIEFQTSNHIIAEVTRQGDTIHIKQEVCTVEFEKVLGAQLYMDPKAPPRMRSVNPVFHPQENGVLQSTIWPSGWSTQDLDEDGFPGITITVKAPLCGGQMYMGSEAQSIARLKPWNGALAGLVQVQVKQFVLGTRGACLSLMARDHTQTLPGFLIYSPLDQRYSCDDLAGHTWPEYDAENWPLGASDMQDLANYFQSQVD
jgi:hypothetical protein